MSVNWKLIEIHPEGYRIWKYEDSDGRMVYNVTKGDNPPAGDGGYYSYGYLLAVKGLSSGLTVGKLLGGK